VIEATFEGRHTFAVQRGLRLGFLLFIVSEIMFFFSFFWAFFHSSVSPAIWIGAVWPPLGIQTLNAWGLPLLNTVILLSSGVTVTWAHKTMATPRVLPVPTDKSKFKYRARREVIKSLAATIVLGIFFTSIQLYEYKHTSFAINDGIYGSVFFLLTGFHGFHVLVGTIFLVVCWFRHVSYHFTRDHHLGFETAIWYWHFVDIVWIFLFIFVYVWGA
jgi:heme/copper-type cytochrome/quinol oxidase subunit 3